MPFAYHENGTSYIKAGWQAQKFQFTCNFAKRSHVFENRLFFIGRLNKQS